MKLDIKLLEDYRKRKLLKNRKHPSKDLIIWNYSEIVQMKGLWDEITTRTRGLVTDGEGNIIAHSFKKFHNIEQNLHKPSPDFTVYEKMDGSLGILFWYDNEWIICSRGSFESDQAQEAAELLNKYNLKGLDKNIAYSFEIIYPKNRIVVDYKDMKELVFLGAFDKDGEEIQVTELVKNAGFPIVKEYQFSDYRSIKELNIENAEGFVVKFHGTGDRTKIKFEDYVKLHRNITNLSTLTVWNLFCSGNKLEEVIDNIPDEFFDWFKKEWELLELKYKEIHHKLYTIFNEVNEKVINKTDFAKIVTVHYPKYQHLLFKMYHHHKAETQDKSKLEKPIIHIIKNMTKPKEIIKPWEDALKPQEPQEPQEPHEHELTKVLHSQDVIVIIMVGIAGSGKSTWSKNLLDNSPNYIRVNRDTIRMMLFGYTEESLSQYYINLDKTKEELVTILEMNTIKSFLRKGYSIIIDDTNIQKKIINNWCKEISKDFPNVTIKFQLMDTPLEECISRNKLRIKSIGEDILKKQYSKLKILKKTFDFKYENKKTQSELLIQNPELPKAIVCDLDGTLCIMCDRSPYDHKRVEEDTVCLPVKNTLIAFKEKGYKIIIVTGRTTEALEGSKRWLSKNGIDYEEIHCRRKGDYRKDYIVKEELWKKIIKSYYIEFMLDDRQQVVDHARAKGFKVFQVEPHNL